MELFALALAAFVLLHVGLSATGLRSALVKTMGDGPYRGLFSVLSIAFLAAMIWTYGAARGSAENTALWAPPGWALHAAHTLIVFGLLLGFTGILTPSPTALGFEKTLKDPEPAKGVLRITRHPFLWGAALWGFGHLLVNPERANIMLFGAIAFMTLFGTRSIDRKTRARDPEAWARFSARTSNVPFAAILAGRNRLPLIEFGWRPFAAAAIVTAIAVFHSVLFGVSAFPQPS
jgi:uncharacterized membrane protein